MNRFILICFFLLYVGLVALTILSSTIVSVVELNLLTFEKINLITISSIFVFVATLFLSSVNIKMFSAGLMFAILAMPSAINNIFPGVMLGFEYERGSSAFPIYTSLELYLFLMLYRYRSSLRILISKKGLAILLIVLACLLASFAVNLISSKSSQDLMLILAGAYHIRIFLLLSFLFFSIDLKLQYALYGLALSILFLFFESSIFSYLNNLSYLASGSLAANSFGNIIAASSIALFIYAYRNHSIKQNISFFLYLSISIGLLCAALTETRMAIISSLFTIFIIYFLPIKANVKVFAYMVLLFLVSIFAYLFLIPIIPDNYRFDYILADIPIEKVLTEGEKAQIKITPENSSVVTRLKLFSTSINMFADNIFFGIGHGRWNWYKYDYGYTNRVLIDSHNGYLANISQYGLSGIPLLYLLFIVPIYFIRKKIENFRRKTHNSCLHLYFAFCTISLSMLIAELSNTGTFKPQIFSLLVFSSLVLLKHLYPAKNEYR